MSNGAEAASREATLDAVHSDQQGMADQLRDLTQIVTRIEEHLLGGSRVEMMSAAQAQQQGLSVNPLGAGGPIHGTPPPQGMLPQMCELGLNNSNVVSDVQSRLSSICRLLGIHA